MVWHQVEAELRARGHYVVAVDLPCDDEAAGLGDYAQTVVDAIGDRTSLVVVAHSFGGYTAPIVCAEVAVGLLVLVAGMVPKPGESAEEMFTNTGYQQEEQEDGSDLAVFYHDVPPDLAAEALSKGRDQSQKPWQEPWPLDAWPDVQTRYLLCRIESGHCVGLSRPSQLVGRLEGYRAELGT